jgi:nucleoside-diphosphate-sugar epimerase
LFAAQRPRFTSVILGDISKPGAFDAVVDAAIVGVIHAAGAVHLSSSGDPAEVLRTNTESVSSLLNTLLSKGANVKRFIFLSSAQAMLGKPITHVYTEDDWNDGAVEAVKANAQTTDGLTVYAASKVLAERAIMDFTEEHRGKLTWDATRFVPCWIFGPIIHDCSSVAALNLSTAVLYQYLTTARENSQVNDYASEFVDVRDVADAFVAALKTEGAGGQRFILDAGAFTYQNLYDAVHSYKPGFSKVPVGDPDAPKFSFPGAYCDASKAKRVLGLKEFVGLGACASDALASLQTKGLVEN